MTEDDDHDAENANNEGVENYFVEKINVKMIIRILS